MADAKPVNPSGLSPQQRLDWQKIIENTPIGGHDMPEEEYTGATIGVDRGGEMVDVPPISMFPSVGTPETMTRNEANRRAHEQTERYNAALGNYMQQQAVLGAGKPYQAMGKADLLGLTTPADVIDLTSFAASIPLIIKAAGQSSVARFLRQLASDETTALSPHNILRGMSDAELATLAVQVAEQHGKQTARAATEATRSRLDTKLGRSTPDKPTEIADPGYVEPFDFVKPRTNREAELLARAREQSAMGHPIDPETVNGFFRLHETAETELQLDAYLKDVFDRHIEEVSRRSGPPGWRERSRARQDELHAQREREAEAARLGQQEVEMEIDRAIERQDPLYESDPGPAVADAPGMDWRDVGPPTEPTPQPDVLTNPIHANMKGRLHPGWATTGRGERRLIGGERDTFAWDIDPDWDDLIREYPTQVMQEGIDDIVLKYQRDLEMGGTPTFEDDFMLLADRAGGVVSIDDLNQWGGVMDEAIEGVNARGPRSEDLTGDLSNPAHPDHYFPGENMTGRDMSEAEAFANRPPFTAKELRQRRINEEEGEAAMALLEEGARTDPPMPPTDPGVPALGPLTRDAMVDEMVQSTPGRDVPVESDPAAGFVPEGTPSEYDAMAIQEAPPGGDLPYADDDAFEEAMQRLGIDPPEVATKTPGFMPDDPDLLRIIEEYGLSPRTPFYLSDEAYELLPIAERQEIIDLLDAMSEDELGPSLCLSLILSPSARSSTAWDPVLCVHASSLLVICWTKFRELCLGVIDLDRV